MNYATFKLRKRNSIVVLLLTIITLKNLVQGQQIPNIPLSTTYDVTLENGRGGHALASLDKHVFIQTDPLFMNTHPTGLDGFTISFYMKQVTFHSELLMYELPPARTANNAIINFYSYSTLSLYVDIGDTQNIGTGIKTIFDGSWHQLTVSWNNTLNGNLTVYVDSNLAFAGNAPSNAKIPSGGILSLGQPRYIQSAFCYFDDFLFYDHELSTSDMIALGSTSAAIPLSARLIGSLLPNIYYSFNQPILVALNSEGQVIADDSGNGYNARVYSITHSFPVVVPSTLVTYSSNSATVLFPAVGTSTDYTLQLAQSGSSLHSTYTATSMKITSLPNSTLVQLYHLSSSGVVGTAIALNDVIVGDTTTPTSVISVLARVSAAFVLTSTTSFDYTIAPKDASLPASISSTILIGGNSRPLAGPPTGYASFLQREFAVNEDTFVYSLDVDELVATNVYPQWLISDDVQEMYGQDPDGDMTSAYLVAIPLEGILFQTAADEKANINPITTASFASPVLCQHAQLTYRAPLGRDNMPLLNMTMYISDGRQISLNQRIIQFNILRSPHLPVPADFNFTAKQDSMVLIQLPMDSSLLDSTDKPYITITELPAEGSLYQVNPVDGSVGELIGDLSRDSNAITQWLSSVQAWSSFYPDPHGYYSPQQILGPPDVFPAYGGSPYAWAGLNANSAEWIEASFDIAVYITVIEVFETDNPGHVSNIYAKHPSTPVNGPPIWVLMWHNNNLAPASPSTVSKAAILSPALCPQAFATNSIRLELASTGDSYVELDAVRITGVTASARTDVMDLQQRVYYSAPHLARNMDSFKYTANSCKYYELFRGIGVSEQRVNTTIIPVNHAPVSANLTITTDAYGVGSFAGLAGSDPDGDAIQYEIVTLPADGRLWINTAGGSTDSSTATLVTADLLPLSIPTTTAFRYEATSTCTWSEDTPYQADSFTYRSVDLNSIAPQLRSPPVSISVQRYCVRSEPLATSLCRLIIFFVVIGVTICLLIMGIFIYFREEAVVKASSMWFNLISLVGCIGLFLALIPLIQTDLNDHWCFARWAVPCLSFTLVFSSLFAKTFRIWKIFMNTKFTQPALSNFDLLKFVFTGVGVISIILLLYGIIDKPKPAYYYTLDDSHTVYGGCTFNHVFRDLLLIGQGVLVLVGTYLTVLVRNVPSLFNEGNHIGITIYNALVLGVLGIILDFVLVDNPLGQIVVRCFLLIVGTSVIIGVLYCTKVYQLYYGWTLKRETALSTDEINKRLYKKFYRRAIRQGKFPAQAHEWAKDELAKRLSGGSNASNPVKGGDGNETIFTHSFGDVSGLGIGGGGPGMVRYAGGSALDFKPSIVPHGHAHLIHRSAPTAKGVAPPFPIAAHPKLASTGDIEMSPSYPTHRPTPADAAGSSPGSGRVSAQGGSVTDSDEVIVRIHTSPSPAVDTSPSSPESSPTPLLDQQLNPPSTPPLPQQQPSDQSQQPQPHEQQQLPPPQLHTISHHDDATAPSTTESSSHSGTSHSSGLVPINMASNPPQTATS